jgi:hypothetical protein
MTCPDHQQIFMSGGDWHRVETVKVFQQQTSIYHNNESNAMMSASYWVMSFQVTGCVDAPHYHEIFVHYPTRFLDKVRRVLLIEVEILWYCMKF